MKLGARIVKTGVAIVFALFIAELLNLPTYGVRRNCSDFRDSAFYLSLLFKN